MTSGRASNLIGAAFSWLTLTGEALMAGALTAAGTGLAAASAGFAAAGTGFATAGTDTAFADFAFSAFGVGLWGFTVALDVEEDVDLAGGRAAFLSKATFGVAFLGVAFPGRLAVLLGFFEGI
jgi:hypothetical protein